MPPACLRPVSKVASSSGSRINLFSAQRWNPSASPAWIGPPDAGLVQVKDLWAIPQQLALKHLLTDTKRLPRPDQLRQWLSMPAQ